jgi:hypothetical protein
MFHVFAKPLHNRNFIVTSYNAINNFGKNKDKDVFMLKMIVLL